MMIIILFYNNKMWDFKDNNKYSRNKNFLNQNEKKMNVNINNQINRNNRLQYFSLLVQMKCQVKWKLKYCINV